MPILGYMIDHLGFTTAFAMAGGAPLMATLISSFWLRKSHKWGENFICGIRGR
jgi:drug/metabolite transporter (DMT)-like permease